MDYTDELKEHRKLVRTALGVQSVRGYEGIQRKATALLLKEIMASPNNIVPLMRL
jgi:cytochrome P450